MKRNNLVWNRSNLLPIFFNRWRACRTLVPSPTVATKRAVSTPRRRQTRSRHWRKRRRKRMTTPALSAARRTASRVLAKKTLRAIHSIDAIRQPRRRSPIAIAGVSSSRRTTPSRQASTPTATASSSCTTLSTGPRSINILPESNICTREAGTGLCRTRLGCRWERGRMCCKGGCCRDESKEIHLAPCTGFILLGKANLRLV